MEILEYNLNILVHCHKYVPKEAKVDSIDVLAEHHIKLSALFFICYNIGHHLRKEITIRRHVLRSQSHNVNHPNMVFREAFHHRLIFKAGFN